MRRARLASAAVVCACLWAGSVARAQASDAAAASAYVQENYAFLKVAVSHLKAAEAAPLAILRKVRAECPQAALHSPENDQSEQVSDEIIGAMVIEAAKPDLAALEQFLAAASRLHWSKPSLARPIGTYLRQLTRFTKLSAPDICPDVEAWTASGFKTLPAPTVAFDAAFMPNWVAYGLQPAALKPLENAATRVLAGRARRYEQMLSEGEARAVEKWGAILDSIDLVS